VGRDRHGAPALNLDDAAAERWIRTLVEPTAAIETTHDSPWSTVLRVPVGDRIVWFKACARVQAFEPRLSASLATRWPELVAPVLGHDEGRAWLLLADAGAPIAVSGNPPGAWLEVLPRYAELQLGETAYADEHVAHGVPDLRLSKLPARYDDLLGRELPIDADAVDRLRAFEPGFTALCNELAAHDIPATIQHDDLHMANVYDDGGRLRVLDWGDSSIAHPFFSLFVTFRFLEEQNGLSPGDPWFPRLRDASLEPSGSGLADVFELAYRLSSFAHVFAWIRQRDHLDTSERAAFDTWFPLVLNRAVAAIQPRAAR